MTHASRDVRHSYHCCEGVCKFPDQWVPQYRYTPADSTSYRIYTTRQGRIGTWECGICRFLRADENVRMISCCQILHKPSGRAPLPYDHRHFQRRRSTWRPRQQCNPSTADLQQSRPPREISKVNGGDNSDEGKTNKYWSKRDEGIVDSSRLGHITGLECQLKTATAHPEAYSVQVNVVLQRSAILCLWKT